MFWFWFGLAFGISCVLVGSALLIIAVFNLDVCFVTDFNDLGDIKFEYIIAPENPENCNLRIGHG